LSKTVIQWEHFPTSLLVKQFRAVAQQDNPPWQLNALSLHESRTSCSELTFTQTTNQLTFKKVLPAQLCGTWERLLSPPLNHFFTTDRSTWQKCWNCWSQTSETN